MTEHQFRIAEIEVSRSPSDEKIVGFFRYEGNGKKKGSTMLIIAEVASTLYAYERLLDVVNATAEQTKMMVAGVEQDPVIRFEKIVQRLNDRIAAFLAGEPTPLSWNRVNMFVIDVADDHICFTGVGRLMNIFFQKQPDGTFRPFDLFGSLEQPTEIDPQKPFASLVCGDMQPGDVLIAGTNNFERIRHELDFKPRLTELPPVTAAMEIKQDVERRGIPDDFLAVIVACCSLERPEPTPRATTEDEPSKSVSSINRLRETEEETLQHLAPALVPSHAATEAQRGTKRIAAAIKDKLFPTQKNASAERIKDAATMASLRGMSAGHGSRFTKKHRLIAVSATLTVAVLATSLLLWRRHEQNLVIESAWQSSFTKAQDNRNRAESDLIYGNDSRATQEIQAAERLLSSLTSTSKDHQDKVDKLKGDVAQLREKLRKNVNVDTPTELLSLSGAPEGSLVAPVLWKTSAYVADASSKSFAKIDLDSKQVKRIPWPAEMDGIAAASRGKQSITLVTPSGKFWSLDPQTDAVTALTGQTRATTTTDLVFYGGKAYTLDGTAGQIWRSAGTGGGFGAPTTYVKAANANLQGAVSLAIDSNVYVLLSNGSVLRFLSGGQEGFTLSPIDPPLASGNSIWAGVDLPRILIADAQGKRVVAYTKDGSLKAQIVSKSFVGPRDVDSDENGKIILVVDGNRLLSVTMP